MGENQKFGQITLVGRPNAGKSTLMNTLLGTPLSLVSPKAQVSRERVRGILTVDEGQIVFTDTPGIHQAREGGLNHYMMSEAKAALRGADLIWYLVDPHSQLIYEEKVLEVLQQRSNAASKEERPLFLLMNKMDLPVHQLPQGVLKRAQLASELEGELQKAGYRVTVFEVAGAQSESLADLMTASWAQLPVGAPRFADAEQISDRPMRYFVAEKIRGQLFALMGDEIPYSCGVEITEYQEDLQPIRIEAMVYVERESQKGMVIGQGAKKIKEIGIRARQEIEDFLGAPIYLGLKVKVLTKWTQNAEYLKKLGYAATKGGF